MNLHKVQKQATLSYVLNRIAVPFGNGRKDSDWGGDTKEIFEVLGDVHVQSISWLHKSSCFGKFFVLLSVLFFNKKFTFQKSKITEQFICVALGKSLISGPQNFHHV